MNRAEFYLTVKKTDVKAFVEKTPFDPEAKIARIKMLCEAEAQRNLAAKRRNAYGIINM